MKIVVRDPLNAEVVGQRELDLGEPDALVVSCRAEADRCRHGPMSTLFDKC